VKIGLRATTAVTGLPARTGVRATTAVTVTGVATAAATTVAGDPPARTAAVSARSADCGKRPSGSRR
jgi:hypothetical protein